MIIDPENFRVNELVGKIVDQFKVEHEEFNFHFTTELAPCMMVHADLIHFGYELINLIENAVKYSGKNKDIFIACRLKENKIHLRKG